MGTQWFPVDGDIFTTIDDFIFYVFGYEHPNDVALSFLKYIPAKLKHYFSIRYLRHTWKIGEVDLVRPEKLYTAQNFQRILETFQTIRPQYTYICPFRNKTIIGIPKKYVKQVYSPRRVVTTLRQRKKRDDLQNLALELLSVLSQESKLSLNDFGIHGSIALGIHTEQSDIDMVVYGSENFRRLEKAVGSLVEAGTLRYVFTKKLERTRKHRGRYKNKTFVYNAIRNSNEITFKYGDRRYTPIKPLKFRCKIHEDSEAMFRPAIYKIDDYQPLNAESELEQEQIPTHVLSMIGYYRNVGRTGEMIEVSGTLERVENNNGAICQHQVVVGTGLRKSEYIWPLSQPT